MDYKFSWQGEWEKLKERTLDKMDSIFPDPNESVTRTTLNQLPNVDRRTTFSFESVEQARDAFAGKIDKDIYLRLSNPTIRQLENMITLLEGRHFCGDLAVLNLGNHLKDAPVKTLVFSCGMAAISHTLLAVLSAGDTMIVDNVLYGCTDNLINIELKKRRGIKIVEIDATHIDTVEKAFEENPEAKLIYFESPTNPNLQVRDIRAISDVAQKYHALVIIDNTFATPCLQNPLRLGADIVVHSLTKYINGHGDVLGGSVTGPRVFIDANEQGGLFYARRLYGGVMDPGQALSVLRGIVTLPLRMEKHCDSTEQVVEFLKGHPSVKSVYYPGLEERKVAERQMRRFGGMVGFEIKGSLDVTSRVINQIVHKEIGYIAVSLGLPYTLFNHPAGMTHYFVPPEERLRKGISDTLVRMSIGLEDPKNIIKTLNQVLEYAK